MRILIAEDDATTRAVLYSLVRRTCDTVLQASNGTEAWRVMSGPNPPEMALIDWVMPGLDGMEIVRRARIEFSAMPPHIILLTSRNAKADIVAGLNAGADDYLVKPYNVNELLARIDVGRRMLRLRAELANQAEELRLALKEVKTLRGIVPICASCKKIRDDKGFWNQVEVYVREHTEAEFTHGICPDCVRRLYANIDLDDSSQSEGK